MPKIRKLKFESDLVRDTFRQDGKEGPSTDLYYSSDYRKDIETAVEAEHSDACDSTACDICAAMRADCPLSAAHLLSGATETPYLGLVDLVHKYNGTLPTDRGPWPNDWKEWERFHVENGRQCRKCRAFTYVDTYFRPRYVSCGNCLAQIPPRPESFRTATQAERAKRGILR